MIVDCTSLSPGLDHRFRHTFLSMIGLILLNVLSGPVRLEPEVEPEREAANEDNGPRNRHVERGRVGLEITCAIAILPGNDGLNA